MAGIGPYNYYKVDKELSLIVYDINFKKKQFFVSFVSHTIKKGMGFVESLNVIDIDYVDIVNEDKNLDKIKLEQFGYDDNSLVDTGLTIYLDYTGPVTFYFEKILIKKTHDIEKVMMITYSDKEEYIKATDPQNTNINIDLLRDLQSPVILTHDNIIIYCNEMALKVFKYECFEDMMGINIKEIIVKFEELFSIIGIEKLVKENFNEKMKMKVANSKGESYNSDVVVSKVKLHGRECMLYNFSYEDYKRETIVENYKKTRKEEENREIVRTEYFANLSHELKTPLNIILGTIHLMNLKNAKLTLNAEDVNKYTNILTQNANRLLKLSNNIIDINKIEIGEFKLRSKYLNLTEVIIKIVESVKNFAAKKDINIYYESTEKELYTVISKEAIERVLLNLISNAIKFTDEGEIEIFLSKKDENIIIKVQDTGIGIPIEHQAKVFERFGQVDKSLNRNAEGSGLGLAIVKSLIELQNGKIYINPEYTVGTEFVIEIPIVNSDDDIDIVESMYNDVEEYFENANIECSDIYL